MGRQKLPSHSPLATLFPLTTSQTDSPPSPRSGTIHHSSLMDTNRRAFLCVCQIQIRLTRQESFSINRTRCDETNALAIGIIHRVAVVRHADPLVIEGETGLHFPQSFSVHLHALRQHPKNYSPFPTL